MSTNKLRPNKDQEEISNSSEKLIPVDPQVNPRKQKAPRRSFDAAYKSRILAAYDCCSDASSRGELLRKEGLYYVRIAAWRKQQADGKNKSTKKNATRIDHLIRENEQLKKKMAQAEAIIELQKKVSDLLGTHILSLEDGEENS
jgi:transposase